jgi:hypothetical protein
MGMFTGFALGERAQTPVSTRQFRGTFAKLAAVCLAACLALLVAGPARAVASQDVPVSGPVDTTRPCSISLRDCQVDGQTFTAYRIASVNADGSLTAVDALGTAVAQTGIDPAGLAGAFSSELRTAALTYEGFVVADPDAFQSASAVAAGGEAELTGLMPGLYLLRASTMTVDGTTYESDPYLIALPQADEDGAYVYEGSVSADKVTVARVRCYENKVTKVWSGDDPSARPSSVSVQIFDGTTLAAQVELSAANDWTYTWEGAGDWSVREFMDGMDGYACSVDLALTLADASGEPVSAEKLAEGLSAGGAEADALQTAFTVTNTSRTPATPGETTPAGERVPKTGDETDLLPIVAAALLGSCAVACAAVMLARGASRRRRDR